MIGKLEKIFKISGWLMFGAVSLMLAYSIIFTPKVSGEEEDKFTKAALDISKTTDLKALSVKINEKDIPYFQTPNGNYIISTEYLAPDVVGYADRIDTAVLLSSGGEILDLSIYQHKETPGFLKRAIKIREKLIGLRLPKDTKPTDIISGATYTSKALTQSVYQSCLIFLQAMGKSSTAAGFSYDPIHILCSAFILTALLLPLLRVSIKKKSSALSGWCYA